MKLRDDISLELIEKWEKGEYKSEVQKKSALQCLINKALEDQDKISRLGFNSDGMKKCGASDQWISAR